MIKTYFITAWRYLKKHRAYTAINMIGLSIGLAACLLIMVYIRHELRYDTFHTNADQIVRATFEYKMGNTIQEAATTGAKLGPEAKRVFPQVKDYARTYLSTQTVAVGNQTFEESGFLYADTAFFQMFSFSLLEGTASSALTGPDKIVLTRSLAQKYFGTIHTMDKQLEVAGKAYTVSAICEDPPTYSQIKFGLVTNFMNLSAYSTREQWWMANWVTYFQLVPGTEQAAFNERLNAYMQTESIRNEAGLEGGDYIRFHLEPLGKVHLYAKQQGLEPNGNINYVYMFGGLAFLILLIGATNYTNLATAQSVSRGAEIGMRKTMGATRKVIFWQFMSESVLVVFLAGILACLLAALLLPVLNQVSNRQFILSDLLELQTLGWLFFVLIGVGFLAGIYPALFITRLKALQVMKGSVKLGKASLTFRQSLIILQFAVSVFLIVITLIMTQQMDFMQHKQLGYQKEKMLVLPIDRKMGEQYVALRESLKNIQGVESVTAATETPEFVQWTDGVVATNENGEKSISVKAMPVDIGFTETMGMQLLAGKDFKENDLLPENEKQEFEISSRAFILNEALAKEIGWTPDQAIGQSLTRGYEGKVVGVVKDFHYQSLHDPIGPMLIFLEPNFVKSFVIRLKSGDVNPQLNQIEQWWKSRVPHRPFSYRFLDNSYEKLYDQESRSSFLFSSMSVIAILLACLGLFGLASYSVLQRTREIGIRKVLGAGTFSIVWIVAKQFLPIVLIGIAIAIPVAWLVIHQWLNDFAYRVEPSVFVVIIAFVSVLILSFATVGIKALGAANSNPLKNLRTD